MLTSVAISMRLHIAHLQGNGENWQRRAGSGSNRGEPAGFGALTAPVMSAAVRRANRKDLDALRQRLESDVP